MNGSRKLFQIATNWNRNTVTSPGSIIGSAIRPKIRHSPAPSMRAGLEHVVGHGRGGVDPGQVDAVRADDAAAAAPTSTCWSGRPWPAAGTAGSARITPRHQHAGQQDVEDQPPGRGSGTSPARSRLSAGDGRRQQRADAGVQRGVGHPPPEDAVAVGGQVARRCRDSRVPGRERERGEQLAARSWSRRPAPRPPAAGSTARRAAAATVGTSAIRRRSGGRCAVPGVVPAAGAALRTASDVIVLLLPEGARSRPAAGSRRTARA